MKWSARRVENRESMGRGWVPGKGGEERLGRPIFAERGYLVNLWWGQKLESVISRGRRQAGHHLSSDWPIRHPRPSGGGE